MTKQEHLDRVLEYILDTDVERLDFETYPCENHVYFHALAVVLGKNQARKALNTAKNELAKKSLEHKHEA